MSLLSPRRVHAGKDVLLFFKDYESDRFFPGDRYVKRWVRPLYNQFHSRQKVTGFGVSFTMLRRALEETGLTVHCNDYGLARSNPDYPVGIVGGPALLEDWRLPNPALLGPSIFDQPGQAPRLFDDPRFRAYVCLADWMYDLFETGYRGRCIKWYAGIDPDEWPLLPAQGKDLDFLIYDKIYWEREEREADLINPILRELDRRGLKYERIRYRHHDRAGFKALLGRARAMLFLSANETQGLAYQEAMASGLPILAWDRGYWADPQWKKYFEAAPWASSVPFFAPECGERFKGMDDFPFVLDRFQGSLAHYRPRQFVLDRLSLAESAKRYADAYFGLVQPRTT